MTVFKGEDKRETDSKLDRNLFLSLKIILLLVNYIQQKKDFQSGFSTRNHLVQIFNRSFSRSIYIYLFHSFVIEKNFYLHCASIKKILDNELFTFCCHATSNLVMQREKQYDDKKNNS